MKKIRPLIMPVFLGALTASAGIIASAFCLRNLSAIVRLIGPAFGLEGESALYAVEILSQLRNAKLVLPWLLLAAGAVLGLLFSRLLRRTKHRIAIGICLYLPLLILMIPTALWLTEVNGIRVSALIRSILPLLPALL